MTFLAKVGEFSSGTGAATTTIAVTGVGFTPTCILFWWTGRADTTYTLGRANFRRGFGVATGTAARWAVASTGTDASAAINGGRYHRTDECVIVATTASSGTAGQLDLQSFDADGFTMIVDQQFTADLRIGYLALAGTDITNLAVGSFTSPVTTGNFDVTSVGFQPDLVILSSMSSGTTPPAGSSSRTLFGISAFASATARGVWMGGSGPEANATSQSRSYCISSECYGQLKDTPTAIDQRGDFVSFLSNGFRLNAIEGNYAMYFFYLAIKGGRYTVGNLLTRTDGNDIAESGFGFTPAAALFVSHGQAESTADTPQTQDRLSIGAFSSTSARNAKAMLDVDNLTDTAISTATDPAEVYLNIKTDGTMDGSMDIKSVDADGFTCVMDDADPSAAFVWYVAFGATAAAGGCPKQQMHLARQRV